MQFKCLIRHIRLKYHCSSVFKFAGAAILARSIWGSGRSFLSPGETLVTASSHGVIWTNGAWMAFGRPIRAWLLSAAVQIRSGDRACDPRGTSSERTGHLVPTETCTDSDYFFSRTSSHWQTTYIYCSLMLRSWAALAVAPIVTSLILSSGPARKNVRIDFISISSIHDGFEWRIQKLMKHELCKTSWLRQNLLVCFIFCGIPGINPIM